MTSNVDKYKAELKTLVEHGVKLEMAMQYECMPEEFSKALVEAKITGKKLVEWKKNIPSFEAKYQTWYSEARAIIKQLLPDRLDDFVKLYEKAKARKEITYENYTIEDYLQGLRITRGYDKQKVVGQDAAIPRFRQQLSILRSVEARFESSLFEIKQLVQADLFDSELEVARELLRKGFGRAAGAVAGVVLERHLVQVCESHNTITAKNPGISELNDQLKKAGIIEVPTWRFIQHLTDLRNLCDHDKKKEPTAEQISDLIDGVQKITKTLM